MYLTKHSITIKIQNMRKTNLKKVLFLFLIAIILTNCDSRNSETQQTVQQTQIEQQQQQIINNTLMITGDNVNVRSQPSTDAKVVTKLQKDESFEILDKSEAYQTIGTETDYWYRIEKEGNPVWVFGAFTSQNLNDNPQTFIGIYDGTEQGDYFYMHFSDTENKTVYDFGEAFWAGDEAAVFHDFGKYDLEKDEAKYVGKTFEVTWKMVLQDTYKGEGFMESVKREIPLITNLKLIK